MTVETFFFEGRTLSAPAFYAVTLSFIWTGIGAAILSFKVGKWIPICGAYARFVLLGFFTVSTATHALRVTHPNHARPYRAPFPRFLSVWLTLCVAFAAVEIIAPGLGVD